MTKASATPIRDRGYAICTICSVKTDRIMDAPCDWCSQPKPVIGMGVTYGCWTDRYVGTIVEVSKSGKSFTMQADKAIRTDKNGMSECQDYHYEANPSGEKLVFRVTSRGGRKGWRCKGYDAGIGHRRAYHDFSF